MNKTFFLWLLTVSFAACGQTNKIVIRAKGYYTVPVPGTIMVDEAGKQMPPPRTKVYTVYVEMKGLPPQWTRAWAGNKSFTLTQSRTSTDSIIVGKKYDDDKQLVLKASKHAVLLQLELAPDEGAKQPPQKLSENELLLEGRLGGKRFLYKIGGLTELASPAYQ